MLNIPTVIINAGFLFFNMSISSMFSFRQIFIPFVVFY